MGRGDEDTTMTALLHWLFGGPGDVPLGASLSWNPSLIALHVAGDLLAALSYIAILIGVIWFARRRDDLLRQHRMLAWLFGTLLVAAAATQVIDVFTVWYPAFGLQALAKATTAVAAVAALAAMWPQLPALVRLPTPRQFADINKRLRGEAAAHEATLRELESAYRESESRVVASTKELSLVKARFDIAIRGSNVTVFTQDRNLRYTSISNPLFGREVADIVGHTDDEIIPAESLPAIRAMKQEVLDAGAPKDGEARIADGATIRWFDLHIEPLREEAGAIAGLTCAAVDVTERKEGEAHLRLLMRELTHRSKNLLAVIQAMARQTARRAGTIDGFLEQFSNRLQALSRSHDLLVQEGWHGAALDELVRSQFGKYLGGSQVTIEGPPIRLRPEAAQSLGLALHELVSNAAKYGALSVPTGQVSVKWALRPDAGAPGIEIVWVESGGPAVSVPDHQGFGRLVIERNLAGSLDAEVAMSFASEGVRCQIVIPGGQLYAH
jgi:PAS domain S-box-containing protein